MMSNHTHIAEPSTEWAFIAHKVSTELPFENHCNSSMDSNAPQALLYTLLGVPQTMVKDITNVVNYTFQRKLIFYRPCLCIAC